MSGASGREQLQANQLPGHPRHFLTIASSHARNKHIKQSGTQKTRRALSEHANIRVRSQLKSNYHRPWRAPRANVSNCDPPMLRTIEYQRLQPCLTQYRRYGSQAELADIVLCEHKKYARRSRIRDQHVALVRLRKRAARHLKFRIPLRSSFVR